MREEFRYAPWAQGGKSPCSAPAPRAYLEQAVCHDQQGKAREAEGRDALHARLAVSVSARYTHCGCARSRHDAQGVSFLCRRARGQRFNVSLPLALGGLAAGRRAPARRHAAPCRPDLRPQHPRCPVDLARPSAQGVT